MATATNTNETRLIFKLRDADGNAKERTIAIPGKVATPENLSNVLVAYGKFRNHVLNSTITTGDYDLRQFVQPSNWRDETGSTTTTDLAIYTTEDVEIEFYTVEKTRYGADDLNT